MGNLPPRPRSPHRDRTRRCPFCGAAYDGAPRCFGCGAALSRVPGDWLEPEPPTNIDPPPRPREWGIAVGIIVLVAGIIALGVLALRKAHRESVETERVCEEADRVLRGPLTGTRR